MIFQVVLFLLVGSALGLVNLLITEPLERPLWREYLSFAGLVLGGIGAFTAAIVIVSALFQY